MNEKFYDVYRLTIPVLETKKVNLLAQLVD